MRLREKLLVLALCSLLLGLLTTLISHVIQERIYSPAVAGAITGLVLSFLVVKYRGGFTELAYLAASTAVLGILFSTLLLFTIVGLQWQAVSGRSVIEYIAMMVRSGVLLVRFLTDFVMGLAALLVAAGLVAIFVVGE